MEMKLSELLDREELRKTIDSMDPVLRPDDMLLILFGACAQSSRFREELLKTLPTGSFKIATKHPTIGEFLMDRLVAGDRESCLRALKIEADPRTIDSIPSRIVMLELGKLITRRRDMLSMEIRGHFSDSTVEFVDKIRLELDALLELQKKHDAIHGQSTGVLPTSLAREESMGVGGSAVVHDLPQAGVLAGAANP